MSNTAESLRRKIESAGDLQSVVRTMKALAASNIRQYEKSVQALGEYYRTVEFGLSVCIRSAGKAKVIPPTSERTIHAIVFGSDQGLVGQFNEVVTEYAVKKLKGLSETSKVWAVGERVQASLRDAGITPFGLFAVPNSVQGIPPLISEMLIEHEKQQREHGVTELHLFHNRPTSDASYEPSRQRLLPLDESWRSKLANLSWPTRNPPQILGTDDATLRALISEYLFVSLFRACTESLASENASRLASMQRADKNIDDLLVTLHGTFHQLRQSSIDEELFDVISGFDALSNAGKQAAGAIP
ncbi:MAG: F0F1 ATP synthase subunit gamma [Gemmatimonadaceae bacterium]